MPQEILNRVQNILNKPLQKIEEVDTIAYEDFYKNYHQLNKPLFMTNMMDHWKAANLWDLDYFEKIGKDKETFISKGNIRQGETKWEYGDFLDYLDQIRNSEKSGSDVYLGNLPIAKMFPELLEHVDFSFVSRNVSRNSTSLWIGPKGSLTGWHTDRLSNNILALLKGRKLVFLVSPKDSHLMHRSNKYEPGSILSDVNMEDFKLDKTPLFKDAIVSYAVIHPKQMLFIPQNWWHCVYGLDITISSNNFAYSFMDNIKMKSSEFTRRMLHELGIYGTEDCVCHYYDENGKRHKR